MLVVMKFGGSSLATVDKIKNAATHVIRAWAAGDTVAVVVSAQGDSTDLLLEKAAEVSALPLRREKDVLLSTGEMVSMSLMAMQLQDMGCPAVSLTGWQAGIHTDGRHGAARILHVDPTRVQQELEQGRVVVVAGFQGIDPCGNITTIGRGGSDTTAVAIAAALQADVCRIYTDVSGVFSADPRTVEHTVKYREILYEEMLELASAGAQVLHNRSVELAREKQVPLQVLNSFSGEEGTTVCREMERLRRVTAVTSDGGVAQICIKGLPEKGLEPLLRLLAERQIGIDLLCRTEGGVRFAAASDAVETLEELLRERQGQLGFAALQVCRRAAKLSVIGAGLSADPGVCADVLQALRQADIPVLTMAAGEMRVSVLVPAACRQAGVEAVHRALFEEK